MRELIGSVRKTGNITDAIAIDNGMFRCYIDGESRLGSKPEQHSALSRHKIHSQKWAALPGRRGNGMKKTYLLMWAAVLVMLAGGAWATDLPTTWLYTVSGDSLKLEPSYTVSSGIYTYSYDLTNTTATDHIIAFTLVFPAAVPVTSLSDIFGPAGWTGLAKVPDNKINWTGGTAPAIDPGGTGTFGFSCKFAPSTEEQPVASSSRGQVGYSGTTYGPVPEPASLAVLALGISGLLSFGLRKRTK
jgi:hypothetical protein